MIAALFTGWGHWWSEYLPGLWLSIKLTFAILAVGLPLGLLLALFVDGRGRLLRWVSLIVVELGRGTPALVLLYFVYFGLPRAGLTLTGFMAAVAALGFNTGAYTSEIFRAGLKSVSHGQREAAQAIGLTFWKQLRFVVLPQAIRTVVPTLLAFSILVFQGTSLAFAVAVPELMSHAYNTGTTTFRVFSALALAALMYAAVALPMSFVVSRIEGRSARIQRDLSTFYA